MTNEHLSRTTAATNVDRAPAAPAPAHPRVLMVLKRSGGRGGMQQQARRVTLGLVARGVPVTLVTHSRKTVRKRPRWTERFPVQYVVARNQWTFATRLYAHLLANRHTYDVVHIHGFGLESAAAVAARLVTGKPVVVKPSTAGPGTKLGLYAKLSQRLPCLWRRVWSGVDAWVSISEQIREDLTRMGVAPSRIRDVPNGVDTSLYAPASLEQRIALRAEAGLGPADVVICSVSRLSAHKRVDVLVRTFLRLAEHQPGYHLWVLGQGELMDELKALIAEHPAGNRVRLMGFLGARRVTRLLQAADVFALISRWEGLSNALLEAMACGLAPLVTDVSGMADVVLPGRRGVVVPLDDEPAFEAALAALCADPLLRERFGRASMDAIAAEYSLDRTIDGLLAVYADCTSPTLGKRAAAVGPVAVAVEAESTGGTGAGRR